ncbi:MAG: hypothetical protein MZU97_02595 [Bacillus subtilis]|nr:hypothetical protein [Bacillus subtilis]
MLKIKHLQGQGQVELANVLKYLPHAMQIMKSKEDFYNFDLYRKSMYLLDKALEI